MAVYTLHIIYRKSISMSMNDVEELTIESDEAATVNEQKTKKLQALKVKQS